jgi:ankyrin repeat protein
LRERDEYNGTPLNLAICLGCVDTNLLQWLTDADEQVLLIPDRKGALPLHTAVCTKDPTVNQLVFLSGTKQQKLCKIKDSDGRTPLCAAIYNWPHIDIDIVRFLLFSIRTDQDRALVIHSVDDYNRTLLHIAIYRNVSLNIVELLIGDEQPPLTTVNNSGDVPLHALFRRQCDLLRHPGIDYVELVSKFIDGEKNALVCQNIDGNTPFHLVLSSIPREMADFFVHVMALLIPDQRIFELRNKIGQSILDIDPCFCGRAEPGDPRMLRQYKEWIHDRNSAMHTDE